MFALSTTTTTDILLRDYSAAITQAQELCVLAEEKGAFFWKVLGEAFHGYALAISGEASEAVKLITSRLSTTGPRLGASSGLSYLAIAHADLGQFNEAWRCVGEAIEAVETTNERWCEAEVHRIVGETALKSPERNTAKAEASFEHTLGVARRSKQSPGNSAPR